MGSTVVLQTPDCVLWHRRREGMWTSSEPTWCMIHKSKGRCCCCCCWSRACPDPLLMQHICINTNYAQSNSSVGECRSTFITWSDNRPSSPAFHLLFAIIGRWTFQHLSFCEIKFHKASVEAFALSRGRKVAELKMELNSYVNDTRLHLDGIFYHDYGARWRPAVVLRLHTEEQSCDHKVKEHKDSVNRQSWMTSCTNTVNLPVNQDSFYWWAAILASVPGTLNGDTGAFLCSPALDCLKYTLSRGTKTRLDSSVHTHAQSSIRITSHLLPALWVWSILSYAASEFSRSVLLVWITWKKVWKKTSKVTFLSRKPVENVWFECYYVVPEITVLWKGAQTSLSVLVFSREDSS